MRTPQQITEDLTSEREHRDYLEHRITHWENKLETVVPESYDHRYIISRLVRLNAELDEAKSDIRLLKIERDEAKALLDATN